jgi:hypothetical protein
MRREAVGDTCRVAVNRLVAERPNFAHIFSRLMELGPVALVGGAPRDWSLGLQPRDIDIVVDGDDRRMTEALGGISATRTSLGGVRFSVDAVDCDVWTVRKTWALMERRCSLPLELASVPRTSFLNVDAVAVEVRSWTVHDSGFQEGFARGVLDLNFEPNPRPAACIAHAISVSSRYGLRFGDALSAYVLGFSQKRGRWQDIIEEYTKRYARPLQTAISSIVDSGLAPEPLRASFRSLLGELSGSEPNDQILR